MYTISKYPYANIGQIMQYKNEPVEGNNLGGIVSCC